MLKETNSVKKAALFDLDGVVFDTEAQYSCYWDAVGKMYYPELERFGSKIKGQTLTQIFEKWFPDKPDVRARIASELDDFERNMVYEYVPGVETFLAALKAADIPTAVVTSSNAEKMSNVYKAHPAFETYFDKIFTSEYFKRSKPAPDCYLLAAEMLGVPPERCVVFEDSFHGLEAGRSAGMRVVGLSTTNPAESIKCLCDSVIPDFKEYTLENMMDFFV